MTFTTAIRSTILTTAALVLASNIAMADGLYKLYSIGEATPMGTIEIQADVTLDGTAYSTWWVPTMKMMLYIPPEASYVTIEKNSPINGKWFDGGWVSYKTNAEIGSDACEYPETDHNGTKRPLWGQIRWRNYVDQAGSSFEIHLGNCLDPVKPWGQDTNAKG